MSRRAIQTFFSLPHRVKKKILLPPLDYFPPSVWCQHKKETFLSRVTILGRRRMSDRSQVWPAGPKKKLFMTENIR